MTKPNLFNFATSELSQDAFICWLLSWAEPEVKNCDPELHAIGVKLIVALFGKKGLPDISADITQFKVERQVENIDILCFVATKETKYVILIEDKTWTKNHSGQLKRYIEIVKKKGYEEAQIIPIYFKTGDQGNYKNVIDNHYFPFLRKDFLCILWAYKGQNSILLDYRAHLQDIENKVKNFKEVAIDKWSRYAWMGFYMYLQENFNCTANWKYVSNSSGGFIAFWWHHSDEKPYLQIEYKKYKEHKKDNEPETQVVGKLRFKIKSGENSKPGELRPEWFGKLKKASKKSFPLRKEGRAGKHMTICEFRDKSSQNEFRVCNSGGAIDLEKTIERLKLAEEVLNASISDS